MAQTQYLTAPSSDYSMGQPLSTHTHTQMEALKKSRDADGGKGQGSLQPPFSSPVGLNHTAQDFPTGQGRSELTSYI